MPVLSRLLCGTCRTACAKRVPAPLVAAPVAALLLAHPALAQEGGPAPKPEPGGSEWTRRQTKTAALDIPPTRPAPPGAGSSIVPA